MCFQWASRSTNWWNPGVAIPVHRLRRNGYHNSRGCSHETSKLKESHWGNKKNRNDEMFVNGKVIKQNNKRITGFQSVFWIVHLTIFQLDISGVAAVTNNFLQSLCNSCSKLKRLVTRNCSYLGDDGVLALKHLKSSIEHVDLSGCILVTHRSVQLLVDEFKIEDGQVIFCCATVFILSNT